MPKAGYEYLLCYKLTVPIYDYTVEFCRRWISPKSRTTDQMTQAARSGMQNTCPQRLARLSLRGGRVAEGYQDYLSFARQQNLPLWGKERALRELGELREVWEILRKTKILPDSPEFPKFPEDPESATNLMITLVHQASYLTKKLMVSLEEKHKREGGFSEKLLRKRLEYRSYHRSNI